MENTGNGKDKLSYTTTTLITTTDKHGVPPTKRLFRVAMLDPSQGFIDPWGKFGDLELPRGTVITMVLSRFFQATIWILPLAHLFLMGDKRWRGRFDKLWAFYRWWAEETGVTELFRCEGFPIWKDDSAARFSALSIINFEVNFLEEEKPTEHLALASFLQKRYLRAIWSVCTLLLVLMSLTSIVDRPKMFLMDVAQNVHLMAKSLASHISSIEGPVWKHQDWSFPGQWGFGNNGETIEETVVFIPANLSRSWSMKRRADFSSTSTPLTIMSGHTCCPPTKMNTQDGEAVLLSSTSVVPSTGMIGVLVAQSLAQIIVEWTRYAGQSGYLLGQGNESASSRSRNSLSPMELGLITALFIIHASKDMGPTGGWNGAVLCEQEGCTWSFVTSGIGFTTEEVGIGGP
ncbi:hypothetical protein Tco_1017808 [Tanacetum coccineum]|uniref:Uncharacterized protein n=1 Tax=Tanacetum coccineum TaxID=301880 RepID=A0ABQ5FSI9_9ASTR